ncbi:MAG: hypothetical protein V1895_01880 [Parcubacteria group bacterium]
MLRLLAALLQLVFTALYGLVAILTAIFVVPFVLLRENIALHLAKRNSAYHRHAKLNIVVAGFILSVTATGLSGCTVQHSLETTEKMVDRGVEFAKGAPPAPYNSEGDEQSFDEAARQNDLMLSGSELALVKGAASAAGSDPALLATIVEQELRWLDEGELERDVLSAVAGEDSSVGLGQVRVSTAEELEQEDQTGLLPKYQAGDEARTERVRRLAANDWNLLYASAYVALLGERFSAEGPLDLAQRYLGASPSNPQLGQQAELLEIFQTLF